MTTSTITNDKFRSLVNGDQHIAGTNHIERSQVWEEIKAANQERLEITVNGVDLVLTANWSLSRKSCWYSSPISREDYAAIVGHTFGLCKKAEPFVTVQDGTVYVNGGGKFFTKIPNALCQIK